MLQELPDIRVSGQRKISAWTKFPLHLTWVAGAYLSGALALLGITHISNKLSYEPVTTCSVSSKKLLTSGDLCGMIHAWSVKNGARHGANPTRLIKRAKVRR